MALRLLTRTRPRRANLLAQTPSLIALGSGAATNPNFSGVLTADMGSLIAIASGNYSGSTGGTSVVGQVGGYADFNLNLHPIYSIDLAVNDYEILASGAGGAGTSTHHATGWRLGGAYSRMTPPTVNSRDRGIAVGNLSRSGTLGFNELNYRFEWAGGPEMGSRWDGAKWVINQFHPTLDPLGNSGNDRPIIYAGRVQALRANTIMFGIANGTVQAWGPQGYLSAYYSTPPTLTRFKEETTDHLFYMADDADPGVGTLFNGRPIVPSSEALTFEIRIDSRSTPTYVNGFIGMRVTRENGAFLCEAGRPYRINNGNDPPNATLGAYAIAINQIGCGQYNTAPVPHANLYMDVGGYITVARDLSSIRPDLQSGLGYWMGKR